MKGELSMKVIRGSESWQFFAFVFAAAVTLEMALLQGVPHYWLRAIVQIGVFGLTFYATMLCSRVRNWLVGQLAKIKELERYRA